MSGGLPGLHAGHTITAWTRCLAIGEKGYVDGRTLARELGQRGAATQHFVIRMRSQHEDGASLFGIGDAHVCFSCWRCNAWHINSA